MAHIIPRKDIRPPERQPSRLVPTRAILPQSLAVGELGGVASVVHKAHTQNLFTDWPLWCVYCGTDPTVPERCTVELRQLFPTDVLRTFAAIGILPDLHLRILASLSENQRREFILDFVPKKYTRFKALEIAAALNKFAKEHADEDLPSEQINVVLRDPGDEHNIECIPGGLLAVLHYLGMEEVGPAAVLIGITTNAHFQAVRLFDAETKKTLLDMEGIVPSPFQRLVLGLAFTAPV